MDDIICSIDKELRVNEYPGRGIVIGRSADGSSAVFAYFIMGRSVNSRNRVFAETVDGIRTQAHDPSKMSDPSLIIYSPVRRLGRKVIVTNGDQTETICDFLKNGESFESALATRRFEPDEPNWTPRISGLLDFEDGFSYKLSILKSVGGKGKNCSRYFFGFEPSDGLGHLIHTYECDGDPVPSFRGEPKAVSVGDNIDEYTELIWDSLNTDNKVSLYVSFIDINTGEAQSRIVNKNN